MNENDIHIDPLSIVFTESEAGRTLRIPKSQTHIQYMEQLHLISRQSAAFVPLQVAEEDDAILFSFEIEKHWKTWEQVKELAEHEKLRALSNIATLYQLLSTRVTFFLHPNNLLFDHNLMPKLIYRGVRDILQPYDMDETDVIKQFKCLVLAMFSDKYTFDYLYKGALEKAELTRFEQEIMEQMTFSDVTTKLMTQFQKEQLMTDRDKQLVPKKRFKLFKHLSIWVSVATIILLSLLSYLFFVKIPYQETLLEANEEFLASDYNDVIHVLKGEDIESLPHSSKYILAYSYVRVEDLSDTEKETVMKNISLRSDERYLLYWIYNGIGNFDRTIDLAKYMDDPQLIMYALIKKTEQVKNDPELSGAERDDEVGQLRDELEDYAEEYDVLPEEEEEDELDDAAEDNESSKEKD